MKLTLITLLVAFASAVIPVVNIEIYLAAVGATLGSGSIWWVTAAAAGGQTGGKLALYHAAGWAMRLAWTERRMATPSWREANDRWSRQIREHPRQTALVLFASAFLGFPPLYLIAVLAGQLRVRWGLFVLTCLTGRFLRFLVVLDAADWVTDWV